MKSLVKGDKEDTLAMLSVLQSKGQFGKLRSVAQLDAKPWLKRDCYEPLAPLLCVTPATSSASW